MNETIRRKRVAESGEWEYECTGCDGWLPKEKFRGCKKYTDPYGNCVICSSCRAKHTRKVQKDSEEEYAKEILRLLGFYEYPNSEAWFEAKKIQYNYKSKPAPSSKGRKS